MIDTLDVFYDFPNHYEYNYCYKVIDDISRHQGQAIHKEKTEGKKKYITTAFSSSGILQIAFYKTKYRYTIQIMLQPIRLIHPKAQSLLVDEEDFPIVRRFFDDFIGTINTQCGEKLLPSIRDWRVKRIDYAANIGTPYAAEYICLFRAGAIPVGFTSHRYDESHYLTARSGNINFYDKSQQVMKKHNADIDIILDELASYPSGLLRLEFQCSNKYIQHLKERYRLEDMTLPYLWNAKIAIQELKNRVKSILGKKDFFAYDICVEKLSRKYKNRTLSLCSQIIRTLRDSPGANLHDIEALLPTSARKQFPLLLHKIRKAGVNPIPLEVTGNHTIRTLPNPYNLLCA